MVTRFVFFYGKKKKCLRKVILMMQHYVKIIAGVISGF